MMRIFQKSNGRSTENRWKDHDIQNRLVQIVNISVAITQKVGSAFDAINKDRRMVAGMNSAGNGKDPMG